MPFCLSFWAFLTGLVLNINPISLQVGQEKRPNEKLTLTHPVKGMVRTGHDLSVPFLLQSQPAAVCNCNITQAGVTYPISALQGTLPETSYYSYGSPIPSSANTGLELSNGLILFLYEDVTTGIISVFLIAD